MSEQSPEEQSGKAEGATDYAALYKEAHPGVVEDIRKAEHMAHATNAEETAVVEHRKKALELAPDLDKDEEVVDHIEAAQDARETADEKAREVGYVYDRTKDL